MNTGEGNFKMLSEKDIKEIFGEPLTPEQAMQNTMEELKQQKRIFEVGEILEIRNSRFRIERLDKKKMVLKLLPDLNQQP